MKRYLPAILLLLLTTAARADDPSILQGLYGYYRFEPSAKTPSALYDSSGAERHGNYGYSPGGKMAGAVPTYFPGILGSSIAFGGPKSVVMFDVPYPVTDRVAATLSIWAWMDESFPEETIAANCNANGVGYGHFRLCVRDGRVAVVFGLLNPAADQHPPGPCDIMTVDKPFPHHEWHHLVLVINEPVVRLYIDSVEAASKVLDYPLRTNVSPRVVFGMNYIPPPGWQTAGALSKQPLGAWSGRLDEAVIWTRALSAAEVRGVHAATLAGKPVFDAKPVLLWHDTLAIKLATVGAGLVVALVLVSWMVHRGVTGRLRRRLSAVESKWVLDRERQRISDDIHDDLGARLSKLSMHTELALAGGDRAPEHLRIVSHTAQQANLSLDELVWALKPGHDSLASLISYLSNYASEFLEESGLSLRLNFPDLPPDVALAPNVRHELLLAAKEAMTNIVKHARATEVGITLLTDNDQIILQISDNGIGLSETSQSNHRNGLRTMCDRLERIGGTCTVKPCASGGTTAKFSVPYKD